MRKGATPDGVSVAHARCRVCGSSALVPYLDLGVTPLANAYVASDRVALPEVAVELALQMCPRCGLSQLTRVVDRDLMFRDYLYVSSTTRTFRDHCSELASSAMRAASAAAGHLALDIASNDGLLLSCFRDRGMRVVGVDPARDLAAEATAAGIETIPEFWGPDIARAIVERHGRPRTITATNVLGHVDNVHAFVQTVAATLGPEGVFVVEVPHVLDFVERNEFDTAYHEHLSYWGLTPMTELFRQHGLEVFDAARFPDIHGGTIRVFAGAERRDPSAAVRSVLAEEQRFGISDPAVYVEFGRRVALNLKQLRSTVADLRAGGAVIWAYGASAKGNTLMNSAGLTAVDVPVVVDDNPKKWGLYSPGAHMRIADPRELPRGDADHLLLLAWNFEREIVRRCGDLGYLGKYVMPVPHVAVINGAVRA